ncbi:hypothetical protein EVB81_103 [Rhizobium phage RHph_I46]|uniref:Uncharacterized protein n=1 Tax=Rhizobium phage RHph_I1_9 TaxID=2509729 RepID=A0A7S5UY52_9CAUD|nr:hypothetical protein PP936_gp102 [Rhizobium phage RHph_I1_9]QIG69672.1 hypothetical protein EVB81_103 [Rhizobium phage RHph_I46]QIG70953.1 hypothetical protein EVB92_103 [Rhizobium phage RHph_I9]QIG73539.1 hypothetical protein EVC04_102 [Rhizobium phage RHph_I1_9]QIG76292.1 hypothetical protein EVC25_103 [Rhizobium phage RHph_I34]
MKVQVQVQWNVFGHTELIPGYYVEVLADHGAEIDIEFEDYRDETCYATVPEMVLDMREYRMTQEQGE